MNINVSKNEIVAFVAICISDLGNFSEGLDPDATELTVIDIECNLETMPH